jgi:hypothetical protein
MPRTSSVGSPDLRVEVINIFEKGDRATGEINMTGTNNGPLATPMGEVPATGKRMDLRGALVGRINAENLIVEERRYYDTGTLISSLASHHRRRRWSPRDSGLELKRGEARSHFDRASSWN